MLRRLCIYNRILCKNVLFFRLYGNDCILCNHALFCRPGNNECILRKNVLLNAKQLQEKYNQYFVKSLQNKKLPVSLFQNQYNGAIKIIIFRSSAGQILLKYVPSHRGSQMGLLFYPFPFRLF